MAITDVRFGTPTRGITVKGIEKSAAMTSCQRLAKHIMLGVALTYIGDIIAYQHGLHFCQEVYPYRNQQQLGNHN
jgi:hypothetical protein